MERVIYINQMSQGCYTSIVDVYTNYGVFTMDAKYDMYPQFLEGLLRVAAKDALPMPNCSKKACVVPHSIKYSYEGTITVVHPRTICYDGDGEPVIKYVSNPINKEIIKHLLDNWRDWNASCAAIIIKGFHTYFRVESTATITEFKAAKNKKDWSKLTDLPWPDK